MKYALNLAADGRILSATLPQYAPEDAVLVDSLPDGNVYDYLYNDGAYVYNPLPVEEEPEASEPDSTEESVWDELDAAYREGVDSV